MIVRIAGVALTALLSAGLTAASAHAAPQILTNHLGYELTGPKHAVVQGHAGDVVRACRVEDADTGARALSVTPTKVGPVAKWKDWIYWTLDFSGVRTAGTYRVTCTTATGTVRSFPFLIQKDVLERHTLSDVLFYFKGQRSSGPIDAADRSLALEGRPDVRVDAHGGWYDASGDFGKHLSHLSFSTYFNPQQLSLTAWGLLETLDLLQRRSDPEFRQYIRRLTDESAWGADYLVRVKAPGGSFYRSVGAPGPQKRPEDRVISRDSQSFAILSTLNSTRERAADAAPQDREYQVSFRAGGGVAIAALARAALMDVPGERRGDYLRTAEEAWAFLDRNNASFTNDGVENIVDDYCALLAATELYRATRKTPYKTSADARARQLIARLSPAPRAYWRADGKDRPFFHAADAGLPVVSLLTYLEIADVDAAKAALAAIRTSLEWELAVTRETANPFGYARQLVQTTKGVRETRFFFPHDTETAPWWQGEDARIASLAYAARAAIPRFADDPAFTVRLAGYALDQLNWILGLNPFDASLLEGTGRKNPEYMFFDSYEYTNAPGGIVNGVSAGLTDPHGIDFNLPYRVTGKDFDWRWGEQWLPHATWYLLALAAHRTPTAAGVVPSESAPGAATANTATSSTATSNTAKADTTSGAARPVIIGYVFPQDDLIDPAKIAAEKLTHINYAFANLRDGQVVEGFKKDAENYQILAGLRTRHPHLRILVSVGGWTWSGGFSDAALTAESRKRFVESSVAFVRRHNLDGFDVDWEYPGLRGNGNTHRPEDKQNFTSLMAELREALDAEGRARGRKYLLTFAAGAGPDFIEHTEMAKVQASVDFVNLMTYDFRGGEGLAGHHSNLYTHPSDDNSLSTDRAVRNFLAAGVPARKLVLGVPFYGKAWGNVAPEGNGLYQRGGNPAERLETTYGKLSQTIGRNGFTRYWDAQAQAPYLYNAEKRLFIAYDDPESLALKARYIRERGLAGAMFWQYYSDESGALLGALADHLWPAPRR